MSKIHGLSFLLGAGLAASLLVPAGLFMLRSDGSRSPAEPAHPSVGIAARPAPPSEVASAAPNPGVGSARQSILTPAALRELLASPKRSDQARAIELLLAQGTLDAAQALLDAFLATSDPILLALLEEGMLQTTSDLAPGLMAGFQSSADPEKLARMARMLAQLAGNRPELESRILDLFVRVLSDPALDPERVKVAEDALVALGERALDPVLAYLTDPTSDPGGAGTAAAVLSRLDAAHGGAVREKVKAGFESMQALLDDPLASETEKDGARKKTGSLAWAVGNRPPEEHDLLARDLVESLVRATDSAQAGTLAWGLTSLKGLSDPARVDTVRTILDSLPAQTDKALRQSCAWAVSQIVAAGYDDRQLDASFYDMVDAAERSWSRYQNDPETSAACLKVVDALRAYEKKKQGG